MRIQRLASVALVSAALLGSLADGGVAQTQATPFGGKFATSLELGGRGYFSGNGLFDGLYRDRLGKFEEYRDLPAGAFLQTLTATWTSPDDRFTTSLVAREVGERDQSLRFNIAQPGGLDLSVRWDRIPHTFSSTARSLQREVQRGVYTLASPRPTTTQFGAAAVLDPVRTQWDAARVALSFGSSDKRDTKAEYTLISKSGDRPLGLTARFNPQEVLEPVEQKIHNLKLAQGLYGENFQLQASYDLSVFQNELEYLVADNPFVAVDGARTGPSRGRFSLAPDNLAHTASLGGGINLPAGNTRVSGSLAYGWRSQDQAIPPHTINTAISDPLLNQVPATLQGDIRTLRLHVTASSRPTPKLNLVARVRYFDLTDNTPDVDLPAHVGYGDFQFVQAEMERRQYPLTRQTVGFDAGYRILPSLYFKGSYGFDRGIRSTHESREVKNLDDQTLRASFDYNAGAGLLLRASYTNISRRGDGYERAHDVSMPELRRFDVANRNRSRYELLAQVTPLDVLGLTAFYARNDDEYPDSRFGTQKDDNSSWGADVSFTPTERVSLFAGYSRESADMLLRSRYRAPGVTETAAFDWLSNNLDEYNVARVGGEFALVPGKFAVGGNLEYSKSTLDMKAWNAGTPTGAANVVNSATAENYPTIEQTLMPFSAFFTYAPTPVWSARLGFDYEKFDETDFRTDGLAPNQLTNSVLLASDLHNYRAKVLSVTFSYRPQGLVPGRSLF